jgi:hypothetical protein
MQNNDLKLTTFVFANIYQNEDEMFKWDPIVRIWICNEEDRGKGQKKQTRGQYKEKRKLTQNPFSVETNSLKALSARSAENCQLRIIWNLKGSEGCLALRCDNMLLELSVTIDLLIIQIS